MHQQSNQLTNLTRGEALAHHQTAPLSSAKANAPSKRRHLRTLSVGVAEGGGVFTSHRVCKLEPLSPIFFFFPLTEHSGVVTFHDSPRFQLRSAKIPRDQITQRFELDCHVGKKKRDMKIGIFRQFHGNKECIRQGYSTGGPRVGPEPSHQSIWTSPWPIYP